MAIFPSKHSSKPDFCICFVKFIYESLESALKVQIYFSTLVKYTVLKFSILNLASYTVYSAAHTWLSRLEVLNLVLLLRVLAKSSSIHTKFSTTRVQL